MPVTRRAEAGHTGPLSAIEQQRWLPVYNTASLTAPPGAVMEIVSVDEHGVYHVRRPSVNNLTRERVVANSMAELPPGRYGLGTWDFPAVAKVADAPALKTMLGTVANAWHLAAGKHFILLSAVEDGVAVVGSCPDRGGEGACVPPIFVPCCPDVPMPREATMVLLAPGSPLLDGLEVELRGYDGYGFNNYHHGNGPFGVALGQCAPDPVTFPGLFLWYWVGVEIACGLTLCSGSLVTTWRINLIVYQYFVDEPLAAYTVARLSASPAIPPYHEPVYLNCDPGVAGTAQCSPLLIANEETVYLQHQGFGTFPPYPDDRNCSGAYVFETLPMDFIVT